MPVTIGESEYRTFPHEDGFIIRYAEMYTSPQRDLEMLIALKERFGAATVRDESEIDQKGCETCDHGSLYGMDLLIVKPTKNIPESHDKRW